MRHTELPFDEGVQHSQDVAMTADERYVGIVCSTADLIRRAIQADDFLKHLSTATVDEIVDCMNAEYVNKDANIIREGDMGSKLYVIEGLSQLEIGLHSGS